MFLEIYFFSSSVCPCFGSFSFVFLASPRPIEHLLAQDLVHSVKRHHPVRGGLVLSGIYERLEALMSLDELGVMASEGLTSVLAFCELL